MADRRDRMSPGSGKILKADDSVLDVAALLEAVYDSAGGAIKTSGGGATAVAGGFAPMNITADLAGYTEIIASPGAGKELVIAGFTLQSTADGVQWATLCSEEDDTVGFVAHLTTAGDGLKWIFPAGSEWHMGEDTALDLNLSGYVEVQVTVYYKTAAV